VQLVQILTILHYFSISQITFGEKHVVNFASAAVSVVVLRISDQNKQDKLSDDQAFFKLG
jgi:hypothetical protein